MSKEKIYMSLYSQDIILESHIKSVNSQIDSIITWELSNVLINPKDKLSIKTINERTQTLNSIKCKIKSLEDSMHAIYDAYTYKLELEKDLMDDSHSI